MSSLNKVMLMGNVTRDIEVRYTPKGTAVADVGLACNRRTKQGEEWVDETTFVDVTVWGRTAELAGQYLSKGRPVFFEGRLQLDTWQDQQSGQKRSRLKVVGENMQFIGGGQGQGGGGGQQGGGQQFQQQAPQQSQPQQYQQPQQQQSPPPQQQAPSGGSPASGFDNMDDDDDIPF